MAKPAAKKKSRKKRRHYITGIHISVKCKEPISYRSSWEHITAMHLDSDPLVKAYAYESVGIQYISNIKTGKVRTYYPDFLVQYTDGRKLIIEVKRKDKLTNSIVVKKAKAAKLWALANGYQYEFWTNDNIDEIKNLLKHKLFAKK